MNAGAENATLTMEELAACQPAGSGPKVRAFCPFHGSDHQRSLAVNLETGHFHCFQCGAWGYMADARQRRRDHGRSPRVTPAVVLPKAPAPARSDLPDLLAGYFLAWDAPRGRTLGAEYLRRRGISLDLARGCRLGYAEPGRWAGRGWQRGRVVFPHEAPDGTLLNLYGRAVDTDARPAPKHLRHDHLPGNKGYFHAVSIRDGEGPLYVCEGPFDALAVIAAGQNRAVAIFGIHGWRWDWVRAVRELVFVLDADTTGQAAWRDLARAARLRGKDVYVVPPEAFGGHKDANAAWAAGVLDLAQAGGPASVQAALQRAAVLFEVEGPTPVPEGEHDRGPLCVRAPARPCFCCHGRRYWARPTGMWACATCHPPPRPEVATDWMEVGDAPRPVRRARTIAEAPGPVQSAEDEVREFLRACCVRDPRAWSDRNELWIAFALRAGTGRICQTPDAFEGPLLAAKVAAFGTRRRIIAGVGLRERWRAEATEADGEGTG